MRCQNFIDFPLVPLSTYPILNSFIQVCATQNQPITDGIFGKFYTLNRSTDLVNLDATKFYDLFGGATFKNSIETIFNNELADRLVEYQKTVEKLEPLYRGKSIYNQNIYI